MAEKMKTGSKGQSLVEAAITLSIITVVILFMIAIGIYIFNKAVFVYAANKAADTGAAMMHGSGLSQSEKESIEAVAINALDISMLVSDIETTVYTYDKSGYTSLEVVVTGKYNFIVPFTGTLFPEIEAKGSYASIKK